MSSDAVITVEELGKHYLIYSQPADRLKQTIAPRLARGWNAIVGWPHLREPVYFSEFWALRDVSFTVTRGETIGIIGTNGSGKSTLLQMICGTLTPTLGRATVTGRVAALLELGAGFNPEFTGRENVYLNGTILGLSKKEISDRFNSIADFADIGAFIDRPVKTYSSGMFVRLAFAVIAHVDADVLVIDEALAVGDVFFTQKCMRFLREFKQRGTIVFVTHDTGAVVNFCDRAIWLAKGRVVEEGPAERICQSYLAGRYSQSQQVSRIGDDRADSPLEKAVQQKTDIGLASVEAPPESDELVELRADQRQAFVNATNLRNDIEVFRFDASARGFGAGGAVIASAKITDDRGRELTWIVGGEHVRIVIEADVHQPIARLIMGFFIKDRLGQVLFGENTHIAYADRPVMVVAGGKARAKFHFRMPILPVGSYAADVAIADGSNVEHLQMLWLHDVFALQSHASSAIGLVGLRCDYVSLEANS